MKSEKKIWGEDEFSTCKYMNADSFTFKIKDKYGRSKSLKDLKKNIRSTDDLDHYVPKIVADSSRINKMNNLLQAQEHEKLILSADISALNKLVNDNLQESLTTVDFVDSIFKLSSDDIKQFTDKSFEEYILNYHKSLKEFKLSDEVIEAYEEIQKRYKLVQVLQKQIDFVLNQIKKRLRNLREFFTKIHSFHFKNLDDYHSLTLINTVC